MAMGVISPDLVSLEVGAANFIDSEPGTDKIVIATGLALSGPDADNYLLSSLTAVTYAEINSPPATPTFYSIQPDCNKPTGTIEITGPIGTGMTYSINGILYQNYTSFNSLEPGTYYVTAQTSNGCVSESREAVILQLPSRIVAIDDEGVIINGFYGGVSVVNILSNDASTCSNATLDLVNLSMVSSTSPKVRLSGPDVIVDPVTPTGVYTLVYQICDKLSPGNCATASIMVPVLNSGPSLLLDVVDDHGDVMEGQGGIAVINVLSNDKYGSSVIDATKVALTFVNSSSDKIKLQGTSVVVAENAISGTYTLVYQVCEILNPTSCDQGIVTIIVEKSSGVDFLPDPVNYDLKLRNFPNPFNYQTTIEFNLPEAGLVILQVYDIVGREIGQIDQTEFNQGTNFVIWRSLNAQKGVYFVRMLYQGRVERLAIIKCGY
jgi:hypothetical protein